MAAQLTHLNYLCVCVAGVSEVVLCVVAGVFEVVCIAGVSEVVLCVLHVFLKLCCVCCRCF